MTRRQKLIEKARNNPAGVRFQEICLMAEHLEILTFQDRMGMAKPYQVKQLLAVIDKYRMGESK